MITELEYRFFYKEKKKNTSLKRLKKGYKFEDVAKEKNFEPDRTL